MLRRTFLQTSVLGCLPAGAPLATRRSPRVEGPLRLCANENPLGPSPAALQALLDGARQAHLYPGAGATLTAALAQHLGLDGAQIVLGAGSSEVLQMAVQSFARQHATFVLAEPTFEDVPSYAEPWELELVRVPLAADHGHDLGRMRDAATAAAKKGPVVVYLCNPNNPTGTLTPGKDLDDWIGSEQGNVTFLVDEAYFEFAQGEPGFVSAVKWIGKRDNVIVTRTFSKIHGMAGLRLGYGLAHRDTTARLRRLQSHNDCSSLALLAGIASLGDTAHPERTLASNRQAKKVALDVLKELGLAVLPSCTNFLMHEIRGPLGDYIGHMREAGILVGRPFPPLLGFNRVTLGVPEDMAKWAEALRGLRQRGLV